MAVATATASATPTAPTTASSKVNLLATLATTSTNQPVLGFKGCGCLFSSPSARARQEEKSVACFQALPRIPQTLHVASLARYACVCVKCLCVFMCHLVACGKLHLVANGNSCSSTEAHLRCISSTKPNIAHNSIFTLKLSYFIVSLLQIF